MNELETKQAIVASLKSFADKPLAAAAAALFESLGYKSEKRIVLKPNTPETFVATFAKDKPLNPETALLADWQSVDFIFQLTDDEVRAAAQGNQQFLFDSKGKWNGAAIESYLFFAITLAKPHYTRTELSGITRAVNRLFPMPAMLLFRHGDTLTLAVINRRLHKRDEAKDVLEKVTLIKDIRFANPHRAHIEILCDLSFDSLRERHDFANFVALHAAWQKSLDSSELNKRFFLEVANWYFWALHHIEFPKDAPKQDGKDHISVIRLITRLMFVWFIKEKGLVPDVLFDERKLPQILNGFAPAKTTDKESVFYRAILQNLFFATLNTEMDKRGWTKEEQNFMAHSLYRFRESFQKPADALDLFKNIPFLNGGLFECLDKDHGENARPRYERIDGFSRRDDSQAGAEVAEHVERHARPVVEHVEDDPHDAGGNAAERFQALQVRRKGADRARFGGDDDERVGGGGACVGARPAHVRRRIDEHDVRLGLCIRKEARPSGGRHRGSRVTRLDDA